MTNPAKTGAVAFLDDRFAALESLCCDLVAFLAIVDDGSGVFVVSGLMRKGRKKKKKGKTGASFEKEEKGKTTSQTGRSEKKRDKRKSRLCLKMSSLRLDWAPGVEVK